MRICSSLKNGFSFVWHLPSKLFKPIASALNVIFGKNNTCRGVPYDVAEEQNRKDPWYLKRGMTSEESDEYFKACSAWVQKTQSTTKTTDVYLNAIPISPRQPSFLTRMKSRIYRG